MDSSRIDRRDVGLTETPYKLLPDGSPSNLSINRLQLTGASCATGSEVYSGALFRDRVMRCYPDGVDGARAYESVMKSLEGSRELWNAGFSEVVEVLARDCFRIFYLLKTQPSEFVAANRLSSGDASFWKGCRFVAVYGAFLVGEIGAYFERRVNELLAESGLESLVVETTKTTITPSLLGRLRAVDARPPIFTYDFGSTRAKHGVLTSEGATFKELDPTLMPTSAFESSDALDATIRRMIVADVEEWSPNATTPTTVSLCLSNNAVNERLHARGRYGILLKTSSDYRAWLAEKLSETLGRRVEVRLSNDADAVAVLYSDRAPYAAALTLGTAFGIGYSRAR